MAVAVAAAVVCDSASGEQLVLVRMMRFLFGGGFRGGGRGREGSGGGGDGGGGGGGSLDLMHLCAWSDGGGGGRFWRMCLSSFPSFCSQVLF